MTPTQIAIFITLALVNLLAFYIIRKTRKAKTETQQDSLRAFEGKKFIFTVSGKGMLCEVVKINFHTAIVRLPNGTLIKRHLMKHGSTELAMNVRAIKNRHLNPNRKEWLPCPVCGGAGCTEAQSQFGGCDGRGQVPSPALAKTFEARTVDHWDARNQGIA